MITNEVYRKRIKVLKYINQTVLLLIGSLLNLIKSPVIKITETITTAYNIDECIRIINY